jgi:SNF2 family DNA or RNA helicase
MILKTEMMKHQRAAFEKISRHKVGALFMEMGTGKTRIGLQLANKYWPSPVAWVCPKNTIPAMQFEIDKHSEGADIRLFSTEGISQSKKAWTEFHDYIQQSPVLIVDESHMFKTPHAIRTRRILEVAHKAKARYVMTGTPIGKGFEDLYCQIAMLDKRILGYSSFRQFSHYHLVFDPIERGRIVGRKYADYVTTRISPYVYQVRKKDVIDLPEKTYSCDVFSLTSEQKQLYKQAKDAAMEDVAAYLGSGIAIYKLLSALQRIACGYVPCSNESIFSLPKSNPRIQALLGVVDRCSSEKIIIWARYTLDIQAICEALPGCVAMHGGMSAKEKEAAVSEFRNNAGVRFLVANPRTGGVGLTLNEADTAIFYSQGFDYIERLQAEDRCHRIGQTRNVHYVTILSNAKIDDIIGRSINRKESLAAQIRKEVDAIKNAKSQKKAAALIKKVRNML